MSQSSQQQSVDHSQQTPVVHVRSDSQDIFDELFRGVTGPRDGQIPLSLPMRQRKLPPSFFKPPDGQQSSSRSHSRESSLDNTSNATNSVTFSPPPPTSPMSPGASCGGQQPLAAAIASGLVINHPRAHSSPATLQQTLAAAAQQQQNASVVISGAPPGGNLPNATHYRQLSYDINNVPLPPGWEMARTATGQTYFMNHNDRTTTWEDPRRKILQARLQAQTQPQAQQQRLVVVSGAAAATIAAAAAAAGGGTANNDAAAAAAAVAAATSASNPNLSTITGANATQVVTTSSSNPNLVANLGPLPPGWQQLTTAEGEVFFANHRDKTTSWFDPRIPIHLQKPAVLAAHQQQNSADGTITIAQPPPLPSSLAASSPQQQVNLVAALQSVTTTTAAANITNNNIAASVTNNNDGNNMTLQQKLQLQRLQELQAEREKMRQRQEELRQRLALRGNDGSALANNIANRLPPVTTTGIDPFLGGTSVLNNDCHSRQESADSGLGLGPNYSHPHTPEDFLSNIADEPIPGSDDNLNNQTNTSDLSGLDALQSMDLGTENMDSDDLVPSLSDELNADDLLENVEALLNNNQNNILTWL